MLYQGQLISTFNGAGGKKAALAYLRSNGITHARDIAKQLFEVHEQLDPTVLGQCLGHHEEVYQRVLSFYPLNFEFAGCSFVGALRKFLWSFRLPGESMQIDRIMQSFSHSFMAQNSTSADVPVGSKEFWEGQSGTARNQSMRSPVSNWGWYTKDAFQEDETPCCIDCGITEHSNPEVAVEVGSVLYACQGCRCVTFCRKCMKFASRTGHAICGRIGYGRACMAALHQQGALTEGVSIEYSGDGKGWQQIKKVNDDMFGMAMSWQQRACPFRDEDAAFVFAFSVIMLTTNLHNPNVKDKMTKQQFLSTNRGTNAGSNMPGDFVAMVYEDIKSQEIQFRGQGD